MSRPPHWPEGTALAAVLLLAFALRAVGLETLPRGILPDEASNGYDAWCLLRTGADRWGEPTPIHLRAFGRGDYRPALYAYLTIPSVALLGTDHFVTATRLPAALCGVATIALLYLAVRRICDVRVAFWTALLLTLSPWHIQLSRFGHESALTPLFPALMLLTLSLAGWPLRGRSAADPRDVTLRWHWMAVFGAVTGLSVYAYATMKLFVPAVLLAGAWIYRQEIQAARRRRRDLLALAAAAGAMTVTLAPMLWMTVTRWDVISARAIDQSLFHQGRPLGSVLATVAGQYAAHFGPAWLFISGADSFLSSIPHVGQLNGYMAVLLPIGVVVAWRQRRHNRAMWLAFAWLLLHPIASVLCENGPHALRAACGIGSFQWLAAIGIVGVLDRCRARPPLHAGVTAGLLVCFAANSAWSVGWYWQFFARRVDVPHLFFQDDLRDAMIAIRDNWRDYDRVFVSDHCSRESDPVAAGRHWQSDHPCIMACLFLPVPPAEFQAWEKQITYADETAPFHRVMSAGPLTFSTRTDVLDRHFREHPDQRVLMVARPGDVDAGRVLDVVRDRNNEPRFLIVEADPPGHHQPASEDDPDGL